MQTRRLYTEIIHLSTALDGKALEAKALEAIHLDEYTQTSIADSISRY